jgi:hypothetical protein
MLPPPKNGCRSGGMRIRLSAPLLSQRLGRNTGGFETAKTQRTRSVRVKIIEFLKWICVLGAIISGSKMSSLVRKEKEKSRWFYSVFEVLDYMVMTRQHNGRIGVWFWIFLLSFAGFVTLLIVS